MTQIPLVVCLPLGTPRVPVRRPQIGIEKDSRDRMGRAPVRIRVPVTQVGDRQSTVLARVGARQ